MTDSINPSAPPQSTAPAPGQIWEPTTVIQRGGGRHVAWPKIITHLSQTGGVYAARYPRSPGVLPSYYTARQWREWITDYKATVKDQPCPSK